MKAQPCQVIINTASGYLMTPQNFPSINKAVEYAKESGGFAYRIFVGNKLVKRGFCE